jgi:signal recognition particle receptor subunit beta
LAQVNPLTRELLVKLVYYGPGLGGKTTSLQCIHQASPPETRGQIVSLATPVDRTLYFDFLPLRTTTVRAHNVRLQLFTVPGQVYFNATRKLVLTGADGVVFVADSQRERHDANLESLENLASNLEEQGRSLAEIPLVLQYNKRDLDQVMTIEELDLSLNALGAPSFPTSASTAEGVLEALDALVQAVVEDLERRNVLGTPQEMPSQPRFARAEEALEEQIGRASEQIWRRAVDSALPPRPSPSLFPSRPPDAREGRVSAAPMRDERPARAGATSAMDRAGRPSMIPSGLDRDERSSLAPELLVDEMESFAGARDTVRPSRLPEFPLTMGQADGGPSWVRLFPGEEDDVRALQVELAEGRLASAIQRIEAVASRILLHAGQQAGLPEATNHPAIVASLLGLEGDRWIAFQRLARRARTGGPLDDRDGLMAFAMLIEVRMRRDRLNG